MPSNPAFSATLPMRVNTRSGVPVTITKINPESSYPLIGYYRDNHQFRSCWLANGRFSADREQPSDLILPDDFRMPSTPLALAPPTKPKQLHQWSQEELLARKLPAHVKVGTRFKTRDGRIAVIEKINMNTAYCISGKIGPVNYTSTWSHEGALSSYVQGAGDLMFDQPAKRPINGPYPAYRSIPLPREA